MQNISDVNPIFSEMEHFSNDPNLAIKSHRLLQSLDPAGSKIKHPLDDSTST
jgi:hypothetical protein